MSTPHVKYLLIGGGLASSAAAQAIRTIDPEGSCVLVAQETSRPYHRPPLSKQYLRRETPRETLFTLPPGWFEEHRVSLRTGCRAARLDTRRMSATLDNGQEISFDRALLATGGSPLKLDVPGATLPNVHTLRTLEDVDRLHKAVDKASREGRSHPRGRGRAAVIGGGFLGVELTASLTQLGMRVDLLLDGPHPWNKFAGSSAGHFLTLYLERHGVTVHPLSPPRALEGDGRVQRIITPDPLRHIETDFVVAALGMSVNKELLRGTSISAETAILTDSSCHTNVPGIYAAGDCAAVFDPLFGKHRLLDHWDNAQTTGTLAGRNMAGARATFDQVNSFFSDVFETSLLGWGEARLVDRRLLRGTPDVDAPDFVEIGVASDGRIAQVLSIGHTAEADLLRELVRRRVRIDGHEEAIKDPSRPLAALLD